MPSMSYCMFENTASEMKLVVFAMKNANDIEALDLNEYEQDAYRDLYEMCKRYVVEFERLSEEFV